MGLSRCKAAINIMGFAIIRETKRRMKAFHKEFADTRRFKALPRDTREGFYDRQITIENKMVRDLRGACQDMDELNHDMGVALDAEEG